MKITGRQRIAVEAGSALLVLGGIAGGIVAFSGGSTPPAAPAEGSPEWVQALDVKTKRSADLGRVHRDMIRGRGQEPTDELCAVEWGKLAGDRQQDWDEYAFAGGCRMSP